VVEVNGPEITLPPGGDNVNVNDYAACPAGDVVIGTGFSNSVMSVGFVLSYHTFVGGFIYNDSSIAAQYNWQAICAKTAGSGLARDATAQHARYQRMRRGYHHRAVTASCSGVVGRINGQIKCLRAGEFCTHSADRQYRRYGFRCIRYYANVGRYRLTHA
jgi:hypothetical protein